MKRLRHDSVRRVTGRGRCRVADELGLLAGVCAGGRGGAAEPVRAPLLRQQRAR